MSTFARPVGPQFAVNIVAMHMVNSLLYSTDFFSCFNLALRYCFRVSGYLFGMLLVCFGFRLSGNANTAQAKSGDNGVKNRCGRLANLLIFKYKLNQGGFRQVK